MVRCAGLAIAAALFAAPASAAGGIEIPEPSDPWLFALGLVGLWLGRRAAKRKPPE